jgi:hypothetical protein
MVVEVNALCVLWQEASSFAGRQTQISLKTNITRARIHKMSLKKTYI